MQYNTDAKKRKKIHKKLSVLQLLEVKVRLAILERYLYFDIFQILNRHIILLLIHYDKNTVVLHVSTSRPSNRIIFFNHYLPTHNECFG